MNSFELAAFSGPVDLAGAAAELWLAEIESANSRNANHLVALSGGRITQTFFTEFVRLATTRKTRLGAMRFFWADERCVPANHSDSNFRIANELLFRPLLINDDQIFRISGEIAPAAAAETAERGLRRVAHSGPDGQPVLDLVFLGLGEDGHVASLFPGEPEEIIRSEAVFRPIFHSPKPPPERVTLGYSAIAAARQVWVLVSGSGKEEALRKSISGGATPLARVIGMRSETKIFSDVRVG